MYDDALARADRAPTGPTASAAARRRRRRVRVRGLQRSELRPPCPRAAGERHRQPSAARRGRPDRRRLDRPSSRASRRSARRVPPSDAACAADVVVRLEAVRGAAARPCARRERRGDVEPAPAGERVATAAGSAAQPFDAFRSSAERSSSVADLVRGQARGSARAASAAAAVTCGAANDVPSRVPVVRRPAVGVALVDARRVARASARAAASRGCPRPARRCRCRSRRGRRSAGTEPSRAERR